MPCGVGCHVAAAAASHAVWACSCCIDMDARRISFCKNGESQGHAFDVPTVTLPLHLHCGYPPECASAKHVHRSTPRHIAHCANRGTPGEPRIFVSFLVFSGLGHPRRSIPGGLPQGRHVPAQLRRIPVRSLRCVAVSPTVLASQPASIVPQAHTLLVATTRCGCNTPWTVPAVR